MSSLSQRQTDRPAGTFSLAPDSARIRSGRFLGIDLGAETIRVVELCRDGEGFRVGRRLLAEHGKRPGPVIRQMLEEMDWAGVEGAAVTGRLSRMVDLLRVPTKQAQIRGCRFLSGPGPVTLISVGSHGFSVLELRSAGSSVYRENSRCSQGTGNFLRQLVERFSLGIEEASELCADVASPTPLSGRCPVILKTDMTHLANKGEDRARVLAGLFDAVCENVLALVKPGISPARVLLIGGVSRSRRVRRVFGEALAQRGMSLDRLSEEDALYLEATGCALVAAQRPVGLPHLAELLRSVVESKLPRVPSLAESLGRVQRLAPVVPKARNGARLDLVLGFDIGSTGSKLVAIERATEDLVWEGYRRTLGDPVGAAQALMRQFVESDRGLNRVVAIGVTGSGREIAGSLLTTCYGPEAVYILNEIAAHATGALHFDGRVDTIFEIGGQDAKYIRLADGAVIDCAMNEACSAGTGSFIEEQGSKFSGIQDVAQLGQEALQASYGVSLGQHCSVFMAEVIDEAVAAGVEQRAIVAGLYDSIIQNYLHRVKGSRSVGQVIFCQGMPFASDALAAAVARQTGSRVIIPPNPGTVGALGIALLAGRELSLTQPVALEPTRFLEARIEKKETFVCRAKVGCGEPGNKCRIDRITTLTAGRQQRFQWGGACALYDKGTRKRKLPDRSPDPFREREDKIAALKSVLGESRGRPVIALSDEFMLKGLFPFFATYLHGLGFDLVFAGPADQATLRRGIQAANVPFCAPMQLFHGVAGELAALGADYVFLPMIRGIPRSVGETEAVTCPIVQASPHILRWDLQLGEREEGREERGGRDCGSQVADCRTCSRGSGSGRAERDPATHGDASAAEVAGGTGVPGCSSRLLTPQIDVGEENLESAEFLRSCRELAASLGVNGEGWQSAHRAAVAAQAQFESDCRQAGIRALEFCRQHDLVPVVVLGRPYTIYNPVLNSNVPPLLREQGALPIPVDCYPIEAATPIFPDLYWGYAQRILRAAEQVRRTPGLYSVYCSNYSCGPDSFNLHFYSYLMEGKPFAVLETDGHAGDAGTKTRIEAFLYCVVQDRKRADQVRRRNDFTRIRVGDAALSTIRREEETVLVPLLGAGPETFTAALRGLGIRAECLPPVDIEALRVGRRYTSGKECLPMCMTLGALLRRIEKDPDPQRRFVLGMPSSRGPCRFGVYNLLNRITIERRQLAGRVRIWSPVDDDYFAGLPPGFSMLVYAGFLASDLLLGALLDVRPGERHTGQSQDVYRRYFAQLVEAVETEARAGLSLGRSLWEVASGRLYGIPGLLGLAAAELSQVERRRDQPSVLVVGEIYVRCNDFANDYLIEKLEQRGLRVQLAPFIEWIDYVEAMARVEGRGAGVSEAFRRFLQRRIQRLIYSAVGGPLEWPTHVPVEEVLLASRDYLPDSLHGEAVLTLGGPLHEWHRRRIDAVVNVGPHECMPSKIAEAQFYHIAEREGLPSLTLPLNGDPIDPEILDNFAFEVHERRRARRPAQPAGVAVSP